MKVYLVGGAVRNKVMGLEPKDLDYVVVDSSTQEMLKLGYCQVGNHFPVFLHPITKAEYALARTEKSCGIGHKDFEFNVESISLEDDLYRRDFTMNAIALAYDDSYIDPFNGINDIKQKIIRHVSNSFIEDPLRVLRGARFAAQYDFTIANETLTLMKDMVKSDMLKTLSVERIKGEFDKALASNQFEIFCHYLFNIGAMDYFRHIGIINMKNIVNCENLNTRTAKIINIAISHSINNNECFINKKLIDTDLYNITHYIHQLITSNFFEMTDVDILKLINHNFKKLLKSIEQNFDLLDKSNVLSNPVFKNKIDFLISILNEFNLLDFSIMMPEEIKQSKINIVNLKRQSLLTHSWQKVENLI